MNMRSRPWAQGFILILAACVGCGNAGYNSGDRVLVAKCLYESKLQPPNRFDVVVFKYPREPVKGHVPTNYIKRLLGLPGEIIAIFFGQLFRFTPPAGGPIPGQPPIDSPLNLWKISEQPRGEEFSQQITQWFSERKFEPIRKPPEVMLAMRRIVNDNNFQPKDLVRHHLPSRWQPRDDSGWKLTNERKNLSLKANAAAAEIDWVTYQHLARPDGVIVGNLKLKPRLITDTMGYNDFTTHFDRKQVHNWVGDLMIEANVNVTQPSGDFAMELSRGVDRFQAKWDLATGKCTLVRLPDNGPPQELASAATALRGAGMHMVRFANFDARLTVWVDGELPFGDGAAYDPPELPLNPAQANFESLRDNWGPRRNDLERPASLGGRNAGVEISDLRLWRDTYYTQGGSSPDIRLSPEAMEDPEQWGEFKRLNPTAMYVYPDHYLCLGDNSTHSSDGRDWGLVPNRLMLGRALMVYYPLDRAGLIR
jgi:signal peptidase I